MKTVYKIHKILLKQVFEETDVEMTDPVKCDILEEDEFGDKVFDDYDSAIKYYDRLE